jgi:hypothetical protein
MQLASFVWRCGCKSSSPSLSFLTIIGAGLRQKMLMRNQV